MKYYPGWSYHKVPINGGIMLATSGVNSIERELYNLIYCLQFCRWYQVNYSLADNFVWGLGAGCRFAEGSCREWINTQQNK